MREEEAISSGYICRDNIWYTSRGRKIHQPLEDYNEQQTLITEKIIGRLCFQIRRACDGEPYWKQTTFGGTEEIALITLMIIRNKEQKSYIQMVMGRYLLNAGII